MSAIQVDGGLNRSRETRAVTASGYTMLLVWLALLAIAIWAVASNLSGDEQGWKWGVLVVSAILGSAVLSLAGARTTDEASLVAIALVQTTLWVGMVGAVVYVLRRRGASLAQLGFRFRPVDIPVGIVVGIVMHRIIMKVVRGPAPPTQGHKGPVPPRE